MAKKATPKSNPKAALKGTKQATKPSARAKNSPSNGDAKVSKAGAAVRRIGTRVRVAVGGREKPAGQPASKAATRGATGGSAPRVASPSNELTRPAGVQRSSSVGFDKIAITREVFWHNMMRELLTSLSILSAQREAARESRGGLPPASTGKGPAAPNGVAEDAPVPTRGARVEGDPERKPAGESGAVLEAGAEAPTLPKSHREATRVSSRFSADASEDREEPSDPRLEGEDEFEVPQQVGRDLSNVFDGRLAVITSLGQRVPIAEIHPVFACGVKSKNGSNLLSSIVECTIFEITTPGGEVYTLPVHEIKAFHALTPELVEEIAKAAEQQQNKDSRSGESLPFGFAAFTSLARTGGRLSEIPELEREFSGE